MKTQTEAPFAIGARVRLARPENPGHPRAGRVGTVLEHRKYPEVVGRGRVIFNEVWLLLVRFDPPTAPDAFDRMGVQVGSDWLLFETELVLVKGGPS